LNCVPVTLEVGETLSISASARTEAAFTNTAVGTTPTGVFQATAGVAAATRDNVGGAVVESLRPRLNQPSATGPPRPRPVLTNLPIVAPSTGTGIAISRQHRRCRPCRRRVAKPWLSVAVTGGSLALILFARRQRRELRSGIPRTGASPLRYVNQGGQDARKSVTSSRTLRVSRHRHVGLVISVWSGISAEFLRIGGGTMPS
jgi:hypothetical protein